MRSKSLWVCLLMFWVAFAAYPSEFLQKKEVALKNAEQAAEKDDSELKKLYEAEAALWGGADGVKDESRALCDLYVQAATLRQLAEKEHFKALGHRQKAYKLVGESNKISAEISHINGSSGSSLASSQQRVQSLRKQMDSKRSLSDRELGLRDECFEKRDKLNQQVVDMKPLFYKEIQLLLDRGRDYYTPKIKAKVCHEISEHLSHLAEKYSVDPIKRNYFSQKASFYSSFSGEFDYGCEALSLGAGSSEKGFFEFTCEKFGSEARGLIQKHFPKKERDFIDQLIPERFTEARYKDYLRKKEIKVTSSDFELPHIRQRLEMAGKKFSGINQKVSLYLGGCVGLCDQLDQLLHEGATTRFFYEAKPRVLETLDLYYDYPSVRKEIADNCEKYYIDQKKADQCAEKVAELQQEMMKIGWWRIGKAKKIAAAQKRLMVFHKLERAFRRGDVEDMYEALRQAKESELLREDKYFIAKLIPPPILDFSIPAELMKLLDISKQQERKIFKAVYGVELYFPNDDVVYYEEEEER